MIARNPEQESALATLERLHEQTGLQPAAIEQTLGRSIDVGISR